jgi:isoleucyl-tRNA synthetase
MTTQPTQPAEKKNYKQTLNLPQTQFPMEAKLVANEPARLKMWQEGRLYEKILTSRANAPKWVLHDGPPFANGDIHIGHVINHVLKDVVIRFRTMQGFLSPYVPGWDCHGLPIEHRIQQEVGPKIRGMAPQEVRKLCHDYAQKFIDVQREQIKRLGMLGDWDCPYVTMSPTYEASQLEVFAKFVQAGLVFKKLRPVPWSVTNQTALAEHELEYKDVEDPSIFVEFGAVNPGQVKGLFDARANAPVSFLVWTTTPWTLPGNLAIAVHPEQKYVMVKYSRGGKERLGVVVQELLERVFKDRAGVEGYEVVGHAVSGADLVGAGLEYAHPFIERTGRVLPAMYVTTGDGTGLVHTAPGHGVEDYGTGQAHGLPPYSPVLGNGRFDDTAPEWLREKTVWEANPLVIDHLREADVLFDQQKIRHSYPHDWRSKTPVIQRAAEQWFIAADKPYVAADEDKSATPRTLRDRAMHAIHHEVKFVPEWGSRRMAGMVEGRPDWSISRQRFWGLPIPVFYNAAGEALLTPESVRAVAKHFREMGSDVWYTMSPKELLGADFVYPAGFSAEELRKEQDTFDVGFDSGSSWHAVLYGNSKLSFPCDMYLEGSDQHRLWFQLSLLSSLGATGKPPFKEVLTHGFVVKPDGTKVSKSDKEYVTATKEVNTHGADLLRLWCCSVDYENDIPVSPQVIKDFGDKYRKIRNTLRYLLSNLYDFNPGTDAQEVPANSLDGWALFQLDELIKEMTASYEAYQLHKVFRGLHDFCSVQISAIYGNAMKDRLYCEAPNGPLRRRAQTVMHRMLVALVKMLAPMIVFTADETWEYIVHKPAEDRDLASVHMALLPKAWMEDVTDEQKREWEMIMELRDQVMLQMDPLLRKFPKQIKPMDMEVIFKVDDDAIRRKLQDYGADLEDLMGVGCTSFAEKGPEGPAVVVEVVDRRETYKACARSWKRRPDVGLDAEYPDLTARDAAALRTLGK